MKNQFRKVAFTFGVLALFVFGAPVKADPLEAVYGLDVHNPGAFVAALDKLFESEAMRDHKVTLWAVDFDGSDPASHVLVAEFDDYKSQEVLNERRRSSADWLTYVLTANDTVDGTGSLMAIQRRASGSGWREHGAAVAFMMTVTDPAVYVLEYDKLIKAIGHPGSIRLMEIRAGGMGTTHAVLVSAAGSAALNEYLDRLLSSEDYRAFVKRVSSIRKINTLNMYRRVKSWGG